MTSSDILRLPTCKGIEIIDIRSVIRIEAISNYSKLFFNNGKTLVVAKVLHWFEDTLTRCPSPPCGKESSRFLRIHRTHIVNKKFIQFYQSGKVKLLNGEMIDVAKRKKTYFLKNWHAAA